jgi:hypothetical protein
MNYIYMNTKHSLCFLSKKIYKHHIIGDGWLTHIQYEIVKVSTITYLLVQVLEMKDWIMLALKIESLW